MSTLRSFPILGKDSLRSFNESRKLGLASFRPGKGINLKTCKT